MAALTDLSSIINKCTGGDNGNPETLFFSYMPFILGGTTAAAAPILGRPLSLWTYNGNPSGATALPTTATTLTRTSTGALGQANATGGREKWLLGCCMTNSQAGTYILYDRLAQHGGLDGTSAAEQTVNLPVSQTRYANEAGTMAMLEIYTIIGTTARTVTVKYTNSAGTPNKVSSPVQIGATGWREAQRALLIPYAAGDRGVNSVESVTLSATTGTAGNFGVVLIKPLAIIHSIGIGPSAVHDFLSVAPGPIKIKDDACMGLIFIPYTTTVLNMFGTLSMIEA
jgi:hypothetical protein